MGCLVLYNSEVVLACHRLFENIEKVFAKLSFYCFASASDLDKCAWQNKALPATEYAGMASRRKRQVVPQTNTTDMMHWKSRMINDE